MDNTTRQKVQPLGLRNNNVGNLRCNPYNPNYWRGQIGCNKGFCVFKSFWFGVRALVKLIFTYYKRGWLKSPQVFASHYAPNSDGNNEKVYSEYVSSAWLHNEFSPLQLVVLIMEMENGASNITNEMIIDARINVLHFFGSYFNVKKHSNPDIPLLTKESAY